MEKYYYQFSADSELGKRMFRFHHECLKAEEAAEKYAKRMGAMAYYSQPAAFAGGVVCVEFSPEKTVDADQWRFVMEVDGHKYYEPNCMVTAGCMFYDERFIPSDTHFRVYQRIPCGFNEVQHLHTLKEWAAMAGYVLTGHKPYDEKEVIERMKDKRFIQFIDFIGHQLPKKKQNKTSRALLRAIRAEQQRLRLPVIPMAMVYDMLQADITRDPEEPSTPTFFAYKASYYICIDYPCKHPDLQTIAKPVYVFNMNMMRNDLRRLS